MAALEQLDSNLWIVDFPFTLAGLALGKRSAIVRLPSGGLVIWSPGPFEPSHLDAIRALGYVEALIAPNHHHHVHLTQAQVSFPAARTFLAPGLRDRTSRLLDGQPLTDRPPDLWSEVIDQHCVRGTTTGEVVFLHRPTRTLLLADLAFHIRQGGLWTRLAMTFNGGFGRFGPTRAMRSTIDDPAAFQESIRTILAWDFDRVIVAHGDVLETGGRQAMERAFGAEPEDAASRESQGFP